MLVVENVWEATPGAVAPPGHNDCHPATHTANTYMAKFSKGGKEELIDEDFGLDMAINNGSANPPSKAGLNL